jgi:hypothetical protein
MEIFGGRSLRLKFYLIQNRASLWMQPCSFSHLPSSLNPFRLLANTDVFSLLFASVLLHATSIVFLETSIRMVTKRVS